MAVKISGVLKDGTGKPVQNCTIQLKAKRNSTTVVVNTLASENPDEAGRYSMDVEYGQYSVILLVEGFPPSHAGTITVYEDSQPGTLNDFLGAMTEDDARPEALRRFELMVEEVARNASAVAQNTAAAKKSASDASTSAREAANRPAQQRVLLPQRRHPKRTRKRRKPVQNPQKRLPHRQPVRRRHRPHRRLLQKMRRPDKRQQRRVAPRRHPRRRQRQLAVRRRQLRAKVRRNPRQRAPRQRQNGQRILHPPWRLRMRARRKRG